MSYINVIVYYNCVTIMLFVVYNYNFISKIYMTFIFNMMESFHIIPKELVSILMKNFQ